MRRLWGHAKRFYARCRACLAAYLANDDPYAGIANAGAFIVWSNQPFYPLYLAWFLGWGAWPSLFTWISAPAFVAVPILARRTSIGGRSLFVMAGLANSMLSLKLFGPASGIGWFFVPCLVLATAYFRGREWRIALPLVVLNGLCIATIGHLGAPFRTYTEAENRSMTHLNVYSVSALTIYLVYAVVRVRWAEARALP